MSCVHCRGADAAFLHVLAATGLSFLMVPSFKCSALRSWIPCIEDVHNRAWQLGLASGLGSLQDVLE